MLLRHSWLSSDCYAERKCPRSLACGLRAWPYILREAETQDVAITRHGKPAGVLIGFKSEDDWFEYRLENDPGFLQRVEQARASFRAGRGVRLEDVE